MENNMSVYLSLYSTKHTSAFMPYLHRLDTVLFISFHFKYKIIMHRSTVDTS